MPGAAVGFHIFHAQVHNTLWPHKDPREFEDSAPFPPVTNVSAPGRLLGLRFRRRKSLSDVERTKMKDEQLAEKNKTYWLTGA